jgi:hypothetical protein
MFELWRVRSLRLRYVPVVGSTQPGRIYAGIDFDGRDLPDSVYGITILQPLLHIPVWKDGSITIPIDKVNRQRWMFTTAGGVPTSEVSDGFTVVETHSGTDYPGELWLDYDIEFTGQVGSDQLRASGNISSVSEWSADKSTLDYGLTSTISRGWQNQEDLPGMTHVSTDLSTRDSVRTFCKINHKIEGLDPRVAYRITIDFVYPSKVTLIGSLSIDTNQTGSSLAESNYTTSLVGKFNRDFIIATYQAIGGMLDFNVDFTIDTVSLTSTLQSFWIVTTIATLGAVVGAPVVYRRYIA